MFSINLGMAPRSCSSQEGKTASSQISLRENWIYIRAGDEAEHASNGAAAATAAGDSHPSPADDDRKGLLVEVSGLTNISSTEVPEQTRSPPPQPLGHPPGVFRKTVLVPFVSCSIATFFFSVRCRFLSRLPPPLWC